MTARYQGPQLGFRFLLCCCAVMLQTVVTGCFFPTVQSQSDYLSQVLIERQKYQTWLELGRAKYDKQDFDGAIDAFTKAIDILPNSADAYFGRVRAKTAKGDYKGAMEDAETVLILAPQFAEAYEARGIIKGFQNNNAGAISDYNLAISLGSTSQTVHINRGLAYFNLGEYKESEEDFSKAISRFRDTAKAYFWRGRSRYQQQNNDGAISDYTKSIEIKSDQESYFQRALARYDARDYIGAISDNTKVIELNAKGCGAYNNRGNAFYMIGLNEVAIKDYTRAIELCSDDPEAWTHYDNRAIVKKAMGRVDDAIEDYTKATELSAQPKVLVNRGLAYESKEEFRLAITDYRRALEIDPNFSEAQSDLKNLLAVLNANPKFVRTIQEILQSLGYYFGPIDGVQGPATKKALINFQHNHRIEATGEVDSETDLLLTKAYEQVDTRAISSRGKAKERVVLSTKSEPVRKGKWAVVIGINSYVDKNVPLLQYAVRDAEQFAQMLVDKWKIPRNQILLLTDTKNQEIVGVTRKKPTGDEIRAALFTFLRKNTHEGDSVIVYYSGHGVLVPDPTSRQTRKSA